MLVYQLSIWFYALALKIASPFNRKAKSFLKGRKNLLGKLKAFRAKEQREIIWFHAASLGEFEQGLPVIELFKQNYPDFAIVVSFFSPSGYERRHNHPIIDYATYLPLDSSSNARAFIQALKPKAAFFIKYEFWYHYLRVLKDNQIPLYSISSRFTEKHHYFKQRAKFQRSILQLATHFFVQTTESKTLLESIDITAVTVSGDTRFDRVKQTIANPKPFGSIAAFRDHRPLLIVGSAWDSDMEVLANFINNTNELKVIIAPHEIDDAHIRKITKYLKKPYNRFTKDKTFDQDILILDTIGMLSHIYQYGTYAYIGGAMGPGLHNILEAVAFGLPVIFGHKGLDKFPESSELADRKGALIVSNESEAEKALRHFLNPDQRNKAAQICQQYIEEKAGASNRILTYFEQNGL